MAQQDAMDISDGDYDTDATDDTIIVAMATMAILVKKLDK